MSRLVDRLGRGSRPKRVYRLEPVQSAVPERSVRRVPALAPAARQTWPENLPRPTRSSIRRNASRRRRSCPIIRPPSSSGGTSATGSQRRTGPERITGEWWVGEDEKLLPADYRVENDKGARFWLFRDAPADRGGRWWLHGVFGVTYAELQVTTHFSFLRGASSPRELFEQAKLLGLPALGIADRNSLAGIVRAHEAARETGVRLVVGCRLDLEDGTSLLVYPTDRPAYSRLCRL